MVPSSPSDDTTTTTSDKISLDQQQQQQEEEQEQEQEQRSQCRMYYWRNYCIFLLCSIFTFSMWGVSAASSKDLSEAFDAEHMFGLIGWANIGLTLFFNIGSIFLEAHNVKFEYRLWANSIFMILGLVLVGSAPTFWLLLIGLLFTGLSGSFGAVVIQSRFFSSSSSSSSSYCCCCCSSLSALV
ncbi:hypothetical protein FOZ63_004754 [Perkinsus olseni]|uniref:Solute carrier 29 (Nucleoside transporters), member n=1 Tax=Perkinsus olseni TaxID=32597 RepID=A0A7J6S2Z5_PEROL|nr:hypothetical protein FOZ63_004754 [Perkinsus olseni]